MEFFNAENGWSIYKIEQPKERCSCGESTPDGSGLCTECWEKRFSIVEKTDVEYDRPWPFCPTCGEGLDPWDPGLRLEHLQRCPICRSKLGYGSDHGNVTIDFTMKTGSIKGSKRTLIRRTADLTSSWFAAPMEALEPFNRPKEDHWTKEPEIISSEGDGWKSTEQINHLKEKKAARADFFTRIAGRILANQRNRKRLYEAKYWLQTTSKEIFTETNPLERRLTVAQVRVIFDLVNGLLTETTSK